jgi:hypothetical protein
MPLPLPDEYATKILSMEMLEHTSNPEMILQELVRVGKPKSRYLITVPDSRSETLQKPIANPIYFKAPNHVQIFDKNRFVTMVENAGLKIEQYATWGFYWTMLMSFFWVVSRDRKNYKNPIFDEVQGQGLYHPVLQNWSDTWDGLMRLEGGRKLVDALDDLLPKAQVIIARKY